MLISIIQNITLFSALLLMIVGTDNDGESLDTSTNVASLRKDVTSQATVRSINSHTSVG